MGVGYLSDVYFHDDGSKLVFGKYSPSRIPEAEFQLSLLEDVALVNVTLPIGSRRGRTFSTR